MIRNYLFYRKNWLAYHIIVCSTVSTVVLLDPFLKIATPDLIYMLAILTFWLIILLVQDFSKYQSTLNWIENMSYNPSRFIDPLVLKSWEQMERKASEKEEIIHQHQLEQLEFRDFINSWVHSVKTPLFASKMRLDTLPYDLAHQQLAQELESIESYINQALYFARLESFSEDYQIRCLEIRPILNRALKQFRSTFLLKKLSLDMSIEGVEILTDDKWLKFIIDQLISNAIKYSPLGGSILITEIIDSRFYTLNLKNQSTGIPNNELGRVFNRGFTGSSARSQNQSTGMGLYLAKKLCDKLGHDIFLTSDGNTFTEVSLRFRRPDDHHEISLFKDSSDVL